MPVIHHNSQEPTGRTLAGGALTPDLPRLYWVWCSTTTPGYRINHYTPLLCEKKMQHGFILYINFIYANEIRDMLIAQASGMNGREG